MYWRGSHADYTNGLGRGNKVALRKAVDRAAPGILAFDADMPVGWCAVAPRNEFVRLRTSRTMKPESDAPDIWSIVCLFVAQSHRKQGVATALVKAAVEHALAHGATCIEAYPVVAKAGGMADVFAFTGLPSIYEAAGFRVVRRPSSARVIVRYQP
jgi:GNAT superfamily N-acetyltransferase